MTGLADVVRGLAGREGVQAVVLVSADGLPIDQAGPTPVDADALAALTATIARYAIRLGESGRRGEPRTAVFEYDGGLILMARAGSDSWLLVVTAVDADVGHLLFDLRHHRSALAALL
jgi:predicted regulator of Ras-like GTPase activity (Roadblock/LC7/MglB family)